MWTDALPDKPQAETAPPLDVEVLKTWFRKLADRWGRSLSGDTAREYLAAFRKGKITTRGLELACSKFFHTHQYKGSWPSPEEFIGAAFNLESAERAPTKGPVTAGHAGAVVAAEEERHRGLMAAEDRRRRVR